MWLDSRACRCDLPAVRVLDDFAIITNDLHDEFDAFKKKLMKGVSLFPATELLHFWHTQNQVSWSPLYNYGKFYVALDSSQVDELVKWMAEMKVKFMSQGQAIFLDSQPGRGDASQPGPERGYASHPGPGRGDASHQMSALTGLSCMSQDHRSTCINLVCVLIFFSVLGIIMPPKIRKRGRPKGHELTTIGLPAKKSRKGGEKPKLLPFVKLHTSVKEKSK